MNDVGHKRMPTVNWDEWRFVRDSLFSSSPDLVASALQRISTWRGRGYIPVEVDITASIIETQQKDPFFRHNVSASALQSQVSLAMQYCMTILRLVNGVIEKTRKKNEISIGEAADAIGIPRMLIDIRHEHLDDSRIEHSTEAKQTAYDDWKSIVLKLSKIEPELLALLADRILEKMEAQEAMNYESGENQPLDNSLKSHGFELLLCLFEWLVPHLKMLTTVRRKESSEPEDFLPETRRAFLAVLLRRCLLISSPGNKQLMGSALIIAHLIGDLSLLHKLKKLSSLRLSDFVSNFNPPGDVIPLSQLEDSLRGAEEKFELIKQYRIKGKTIEPKEFDLKEKTEWKGYSACLCPIGMLPCTTGFSSGLPIPVCTHESTRVLKLADNKECSGLKQCNKRKAESPIQELDSSLIKKVKKTKPDCESYGRGDVSSKGVKGHLLIDGVWKKVGEDDILAIASVVRLLV